MVSTTFIACMPYLKWLETKPSRARRFFAAVVLDRRFLDRRFLDKTILKGHRYSWKTGQLLWHCQNTFDRILVSFECVAISGRKQVSKTVHTCLEFEMKKSSDSPRRWLRYEALEPRAMMAGDLMELHNFIMPEDCDNSGSVSPLDALMVINSLNQPNSGAADATRFIDVDADGRTSPLDALVVINYLNSKSPEAPSMPSGAETDWGCE